MNTPWMSSDLTTQEPFQMLSCWIWLFREHNEMPKSNFCSSGTKYKGVDDDSRYGGADYKAKDQIYSEVGCKGDGDSKHSLQSDGQQQDETSTVPWAKRYKSIMVCEMMPVFWKMLNKIL